MKHLARLLLLLLLGAPALAEPSLVERGKVLAEQNCITCHAVGVKGESLLRDAPPFRDIAANYDEDELEDSFNDGVATEHPAMPDWKMTPSQAAALAAYIMSLSVHGVKKSGLVP